MRANDCGKHTAMVNVIVVTGHPPALSKISIGPEGGTMRRGERGSEAEKVDKWNRIVLRLMFFGLRIEPPRSSASAASFNERSGWNGGDATGG